MRNYPVGVNTVYSEWAFCPTMPSKTYEAVGACMSKANDWIAAVNTVYRLASPIARWRLMDTGKVVSLNEFFKQTLFTVNNALTQPAYRFSLRINRHFYVKG
jgi:hypothetical protein